MGHHGVRAFLGSLLLLGLGCLRPPVVVDGPGPPPAPREFRGLWVATVANIDWPSAPDLTPEAQRAEALAILDRARAVGLNAIVLQVRPAADALYPSELEPWSEFLTGRQGQGPEPAYDPLAFWITEAHRAGLELHAWFNPFRAAHARSTPVPAPTHVRSARPELVRTYGDQAWLDPAEPGAEDHTLAVILDVVRRYDLDGVHLDDYFYPYPVKEAEGRRVDFPDDGPWEAYRAAGGDLSRAAWRRAQVDRFIERMYREVHQVKPHVRVGLSPFGLGRPDLRPPTISGFSQYDELYADVERWLACGWLDYLAPQLYWRRDTPGRGFLDLLDAWRAADPLARPIWPGLFTSQTHTAAAWPAEEILGQIEAARSRGGALGHLHYSATALMRNRDGIAERLAELYGGPALVPAAPWLGGAAPAAPRVRIERGPDLVRLHAEDAGKLVVWARYGKRWRFLGAMAPGGALPRRATGEDLVELAVSALGPTGLEGPPLRLSLEPR